MHCEQEARLPQGNSASAVAVAELLSIIAMVSSVYER